MYTDWFSFPCPSQPHHELFPTIDFLFLIPRARQTLNIVVKVTDLVPTALSSLVVVL